MSESDREAAFLEQVLSYDDTPESRALKTRITQAQQDQQCVQRVLRVTARLALLAVICLGYWEMFLGAGVSNVTSTGRNLVADGFCGLGLGSLISVVVFVGLGFVYRERAVQRRAEVRRFAAKLLETRLGKASPSPLPDAGNGP